MVVVFGLYVNGTRGPREQGKAGFGHIALVDAMDHTDRGKIHYDAPFAENLSRTCSTSLPSCRFHTSKDAGKARRRHASPQASIVTTSRSREHQCYLPAQQPRVPGGGILYGGSTGGGVPRAWDELSDGQTET